MFTKKNKKKMGYVNKYIILILFVLILFALIFGIVSFIMFKKTYTEHNETYKRIVSTYNEFENHDWEEETAIIVFSEAFENAESKEQSSTIEEAIMIMQNQYDNFISSWTIIITVLGIAATIIIVIMPLFNHLFFQKDMINDFNNEVKKLKKRIISVKRSFKEIEDRENLMLIQQSIGRLLERENRTEYISLNESSQLNIKDDKNLETIVEHLLNIKTRYKSIKDDSIKSAAAIFISDFYLQFKEYKKALGLVSKAIEINKKEGKNYYQRGVCYYLYSQAGNNTKRIKEDLLNNALSDFDEAIELGYNESADIYYRIFLCHKELSNGSDIGKLENIIRMAEDIDSEHYAIQLMKSEICLIKRNKSYNENGTKAAQKHEEKSNEFKKTAMEKLKAYIDSDDK